MEWLKQVLTSHLTGQPSTKRHVVLLASVVLCLVTLALGTACACRIKTSGDVGSGAVAALTFCAGITATLAGAAYRKPEEVKA